MNISLDGLWQCRLPDGREFELTVPGCYDTYIDEKDLAGPVILERQFQWTSELAKPGVITFEQVSYYCEVYLNGVHLGSHEGMWDQFSFPLLGALQVGANTLTVHVTKPGYHTGDRFPVREVLSGFLPDVLCTFGGIWGSVAICDSDEFWIDYHYSQGDDLGNFYFVAEAISGSAEEIISVDFSLLDSEHNTVFQKTFDWESKEALRMEGQLLEAKLWSEHEPILYQYQCNLRAGKRQLSLSGQMGFRSVSHKGCRLLLNQQPIYLRGALHWGLYDRKIIPVPTLEEINGEINGIKAYGFNALKHCLYIPSEAYLSACDRAGILQWVELPLWLVDKNSELPERVRREYPRILNKLMGHPSVILFSLGCELDTAVPSEVLEEMYYFVSRQTGALVCDNSGSGECYEGAKVSFSDFFDYHFYGDLHNMEPLIEAFTPAWRSQKPWLFGEFADADSLIDLAPLRQAYGVERLQWESGDPSLNPLAELKPDFFAHHHDERIMTSGIRQEYERLHGLSINHCLTHRKLTLELTRSFPEISGYNITAIRDVPLSADGLFDALGEPKYDQALFRMANQEIVLCPAWDLTRIWINADRVQTKDRFSYWGGQTTGQHVLISNFSRQNITEAKVNWWLMDEDKVIGQGSLAGGGEASSGEVIEAGVIRCPLPKVTTPRTFVIKVALEGSTVENQWPVFVYPEEKVFSGKIGLVDPAGVFQGLEEIYDVTPTTEGADWQGFDLIVTSYLSQFVKDYAARGGRVFFCQTGLLGGLPALPVCFWRESTIDRAGDSFLGKIPYEHFSDDLRFWSVGAELAFQGSELEAAGFSQVESWLKRYDARKWLRSDYVLKLQHGEGKIIATTLALAGGMGKQPLGLLANVFARWFMDQALQDLVEDT